MHYKIGSKPLLCLIFMVSFSGLMIQIVLTRIFSVAFWYHYSFLAISIALLGWGTGALLVYRQQFSVQDPESTTRLLIYGSLFAISVPLCLFLFSKIPAYVEILPIFYIIGSIPFFFGGACVSLSFRIMQKKITRLYFADLTGAAIASLVLEPALYTFGAESLILFIGTLSSIVFLLLAFKDKTKYLKIFLILVIFVNSSLLVGNINHNILQINPGPSKSIDYSKQNVTWTAWNSISKVDLVEGDPTYLENNWVGVILMDAGTSTAIIKWDGKTNGTLSHLKAKTWTSDELNYLPFDVINTTKMLIIGSGGGSEIAFALTANVQNITAVELNPHIVTATRRLGALSGFVYDRPEVEVVIDDGRSFIARTNEKYDMIYLKLVDTSSALSTGGYSLIENYLYTVEAFEEYLSHLTDDGMLLLVRWDFEMPKLVSLTIDALFKYGIELDEASQHIVALIDNDSEISSTNFPLIFMVKKNAFTLHELEQIYQIIEFDKNKILFLPGIYGESIYKELFEGSISLSEFYNSFWYNRVRSPTDDRPFYFAIEEPFPATIWTLLKIIGGISFIYAIILIFMHRKGMRKTRIRFKDIIYFVSIGIAYIIVEVTLVQEFMVFLGYPTRAIVIILFSLLFGSGVGSFLSNRITDKKIKLARNLLLFIPLILIIYKYSLPQIFQILQASDITIRVSTAVLLVLPLGMLMGIPFPTGLRHLPSSNDAIPLFWGMNGIASVLGSVIAASVGLWLGFGANLLLSAFAYIIPPAVLTLSSNRI